MAVLAIVSSAVISSVSCIRNPNIDPGEPELGEEYYTGGKNGTTFLSTSKAYEQPAPAVTDAIAFLRGETLFEGRFVSGDGSTPFSGLGPAYIRSSCKDCHPSYGHGRRMERYNADDYGNGYLLVIYDDDGKLCPQFTGMPQTRATHPFLPPINESGITITWHNHIDEFGNKYPDGETYSLIYPTVSIDPNAMLPELVPAKYNVAIEATIGIYGTGLLDAITEQDLIDEHAKQQARGYCQGMPDLPYAADENGTMKVGRYTYGCTRSTLQNGPGANAIWNITNVTRPDRRYHYITTAYATAMANNTDVQNVLGISSDSVYNYLMSTSLEAEMTTKDFDDFMIWHRGLAVPAARNLDDETVKEGKKHFYDMGCTACHKPSWTTGEDTRIPGFSNQKIWPYTDLLRHNLNMKEPGLRLYCRTTPLWGRGLSKMVTGYDEHLHDMRARSYEEAILWHGGEAAAARDKFRNLTKDQRAAVVKFLEAI
ncbi:MAG: c-type cytochrome [Bacteroidales bacterium]|nr:c-type cytochrome [Bacteroidales bacterium]